MAEQVLLIILFIVFGFFIYNRKMYIATREEFDLLAESVGNILTLFSKYNEGK